MEDRRVSAQMTTPKINMASETTLIIAIFRVQSLKKQPQHAKHPKNIAHNLCCIKRNACQFKDVARRTGQEKQTRYGVVADCCGDECPEYKGGNALHPPGHGCRDDNGQND